MANVRRGTDAGASILRSMHVPGTPIVLPNAWDASSARTFADAGFGAIATSSAAVAEVLGYADGEATPPDEMFAAVGRIAAAVDVPVTADIERGYGLEPPEIVERLLDAGAVGCNVEDSDPASGELIDPDRQSEWLAELRAAASRAGVAVVLNARIDVHLREWGDPEGRVEASIERGRRYLEAGADCVFPLFLNDGDALRRFVRDVGGPVNATPSGALRLEELGPIGVARVTFGPGLYRQTYAGLATVAEKIARGVDPYVGT